MFRNIIITILVISACSGEYPVPYYSLAGSTGLASPRFQRDDTPLSFQYNTIRLHSSPSPDHDGLDHQPHHYNLSPTSFINIQYAPLVKPSSRLYTKVHSPHETRNFDKNEAALISPRRHTAPPTTTTVKTDHLEPRFVATRATDLQPQPLPHLDYIPGHNIEVLRSVNRSPGTNSVFKNYPASASPESINNLPQKTVNLLTPYKFSHPSNKRPQLEMSTQNIYFSLGTADRKSTAIVTTTNSFPTTTTTMPPPLIYRDYGYKVPRNRQPLIVPKPIIYNTVDMTAVKNEPTILKPPQQKSPYMKMHTLLLNVARAYNMAFATHRTASHSGSNPSVLGIFQPYTKTYVRAPRLPQTQQQNRISANQKTILYPIQKNLRFAIHS